MRRARSRTVVIIAATLCLAASADALGASLKITIRPKHPGVSGVYVLTLKGRAPGGGRLGPTRNASEIDIVEQVGGRCAATPRAELAKRRIKDLGPVFVHKGRFHLYETRKSTPSPGTTIRFCGYLSKSLHKLVARATAKYTS